MWCLSLTTGPGRTCSSYHAHAGQYLSTACPSHTAIIIIIIVLTIAKYFPGGIPLIYVNLFIKQVKTMREEELNLQHQRTPGPAVHIKGGGQKTW